MSSSELTPVAALPADREPLDARSVDRWVWLLLALGLAARALRYFLRFPLWDDECFLMVNLIDRGYADLLRPLDYHQVAPLLFLWLERTLIDWFGYNELVMRLPALVGGCASLLLFRHIARRLLSGSALIAATAIFAVAYPCIRYSAEAKPYGTDLFAGLTLMALAVEWRRRPQESRRGWMLAAIAPVLVGLSYPATFVAGGMSLWVAAGLRTGGSRRSWIAWGCFNALLTAAFVGFLLSANRSHAEAELPFMTEYWQTAFPPIREPWLLPVWFVEVLAGPWLAYPIGGENGASALTFVLVATATAVWIYRRERTLLGFCLLPPAVHLLAAALQRYPFGGHVKFAHYAAGPICLAAGFGLATAVGWAARRRELLLPMLRVATAAVALVGVGGMIRDFARPQKTLSDARHRDFARWFWFNAAEEGEACCVLSDLKQSFAPEAKRQLNWTATYLCNQRIYSPRHRRGEPIHWERISDEHPLRCVLFTTPLAPHDEAAERRWADEMQTRYDLAGRETYPFYYYAKNDRDLGSRDHVTIYRFVPKREATAGRPGDERR